MAKLVISGAKLKCDQGMAPGSLTVLPVTPVNADEEPAATILDMAPMVNISTFGMCQTEANPEVAAATAAAMGALTPMPCVPVIPAPWSPGASTAIINGLPVLTDSSKCLCMWTGNIEITDPGSDIDVT
jgi:hypothetical protein